MSILREARRCLSEHNIGLVSKLNAFTAKLATNEIFQKAQEVDDRIAEEGKACSVMDGQLIAVKDNFCTNILDTTCASNILAEFDTPYEATVVSRLRRHGGIIIGKTNMDEFGMGSHSTHSRQGPVRSPVEANATSVEAYLSSGGSSGGSAVAVATGICHVALGSDTGGSVRLPASYCGVVGFKPSYGLLSRRGLIAYAHSFDTVGIFGSSVGTVQRTFEVANAYDPQDPTSLHPESRNKLSQVLIKRKAEQIHTKLRIGVPKEFVITELSSEIRATWEASLNLLSDHGHEIVDISLPSVKQALSAYYIVAPAEASSNLAKYDGIRYGKSAALENRSPPTQNTLQLYEHVRNQGFGDEVKRRITLGTYTLSAEALGNYFIKAQKIRRLVQQDFNNVLSMTNILTDQSDRYAIVEDPGQKVDVIVTPVATSTAPEISLGKVGSTPLENYVNDVFTIPASMAGIPCISIPARRDKSQKPIGIQIMAQYGDDDRLLQIAEELERLYELQKL